MLASLGWDRTPELKQQQMEPGSVLGFQKTACVSSGKDKAAGILGLLSAYVSLHSPSSRLLVTYSSEYARFSVSKCKVRASAELSTGWTWEEQRRWVNKTLEDKGAEKEKSCMCGLVYSALQRLGEHDCIDTWVIGVSSPPKGEMKIAFLVST